jgi:3-oxoacyl-[acyl-carrier-protein] synthase III
MPPGSSRGRDAGQHGSAAPGAGGRSAIICGIGASLPPTVVSNADLCARLDTTDEWIRARTGISRRRIAGAGISTEDLAAEAAADALRSSGGGHVQALVLATTTPDLRCPATAPVVAARLGLTGTPALDLAAGCTGFLYALLAQAAGDGQIAPGHRLLLTAFGTSLT